ncbi:MAG: 3-hydroxyacyl-CoA dehydrogenase/enoyl-CoA hydratase family protein [Flavobacteriales bacterium]|nr:3-hydroxyacyl-CoA dehydrogenase/enoyl-CoA hydratase family protein [Flavobacteriales bacterium]
MRTIKTVGVVGAGTMGAAIAQKFAQEGFTVLLADRDQASVEKGLGHIRAMLAQGVERKVFSEALMNDALARITGTADLHDMKGCDLVVEAIFEDRDAKAQLFRTLDAIVPPTTILATNTSSFSITDLATFVSHPERFIGLHYFYHAAKNRLVEIIPGAHTSSEVFDAVRAFCERSGKDAITCKDANGFVVNRYFVPWLNEAARLLDEGVADIPTIDAVCMRTFGIGMGPFALMNATGVPVAYHAQRTLEVFGPLYAVSDRLKQQAEAKQLWVLEGEADTDEAKARTISERMLGTVFLVCSQLLDEQVCGAVEINRGARIGLRWRKGPIDLMARYGDAEVRRLVAAMAARYGTPLPSSIGSAYWRMGFVGLRKKGGIAVIELDRPEDSNALNELVMRQLDAKFKEADQTPAIHTIFIIGSGKAFMAGADIKFFVDHMKKGDLEGIDRFTKYGQEVFARIDSTPKQVVAVLNGLTLGGGLELALCADLILALPGAKLAFPETGIGIYPGLGGTQRSVDRVGKGLAKYLIHTGRMLDATQAEEIGLVDRVIDRDRLADLLDGREALPQRSDPELTTKWRAFADFFGKHGVDELLTMDQEPNGLDPQEAARIKKILSSKAPIALRLADRLIDEAKGPSSELEHLQTVFSSKDAMLGLTSIGKKVEYSGV